MGEIAEAMYNGLFCATCGEMLDGDEPGHPRYCSAECEPPDYSDPVKPKKQLTEAQRNKRREKRRRYRARKRARDQEPKHRATEYSEAEIDAIEDDAMRNMGLDDAVDFGLEDVGNK